MNTETLKVETGLLESAIAMLEKSVGIDSKGGSVVTPDDVWRTCKELFFSVPASPEGSAHLSEREKDRQLEENLGMSKAAFLKRTKIRLDAFRRQDTKQRQIARRGK